MSRITRIRRPQPSRRRRIANLAALVGLGLLVVLVVRAVVPVFQQVVATFSSDSAGGEARQAVAPLPPEPVTPPLDFAGFDAGNIIADEVFYDESAMSQRQIQEFLTRVGEGCRQGEDGTECLAVYTEDSPSYDASDYCFAFEGRAGDTAASIISKAGTACGINPQVLLVMLQKEQGLLTASGSRLHEGRYDTAMGYGCPDTATCDPKYFGLSNQVYRAAMQLRMYANSPQKYQIRPFKENTVLFHPDSACGGQKVFVENYATAGLYNYTPYQPDSAALQGQPGACSAVGNLNFYAYFNAWFGSP